MIQRPVIDLAAGPSVAGRWDNRRLQLAKMRRNRLLDTFLGASTVSLPDVYRDRECIDDLFVAVTERGERFAVPILVLPRDGRLRVTRFHEAVTYCRQTLAHVTPRPVAVQFVRDGDRETIVMFALAEVDGEIKALDEKHYRLVPASEITADDLNVARMAGSTR